MQQIRNQFSFYIKHSLRDMGRNGTRTIFALFCIATGVAAVVALRSLALMIGDEFTTNLAELNRGDMQVVATDELDTRYYTQGTQADEVFTEAGMDAMRAFAANQDAEIQFASNTNFVQILRRGEDGAYESPFSVVGILVEPDKWPFYGVVVTTDGRTLNEALSPERTVILSRRSARENAIEIGDELFIGGSTTPVIVGGFVDDETEGALVLRNGPTGLLGFIYYPLAQAEDIGLDPRPSTAYFQIPLGRDVTRLEEALEARFGDEVSEVTTAELEETNQQTADLISDLILVMGLSSVLIGGIGIINTMQVIVGRRTLEIAVLKTMGLKAWRVTLLFLVEAVLMGIFGSLIGIVAGIGLSYVVRNVGEDVLRSELSWRAYPEAWFSGLTLGIVLTVAFGFLPTLIAGQVRPAIVLRPNEVQLPNAGLWRTLFALVFIIVIFGLTLNIIVSGRLEVPVTLMLGLGGFIIGLFGGIMVANEGVMEAIPPQPDPRIIQRGYIILAGGIASLSLIGLFAVNLALTPVAPLIIYGLPAVLGVGLYFGLKSIGGARVGEGVARTARQVLLLGGALALGGLITGGLIALIVTLIDILYPLDDAPGYFTTLRITSALIGLVTVVMFRLRGRRIAGIVGLALIGALVLSVIGFGVGDVLDSLFGGTAFWSGVERLSVGIIVVEIIALAVGGTFGLLLGVVWLMGKIPHFGNVDVKISLRNIANRKARTSSTMIGLIAGIAALSLITLTTSAVTTLLESQLETDAGGNVAILSLDPATGEAVRKRLDERLEGVNSYTQFSLYQGRLWLVDGQEPEVFIGEAGDEAEGNRFEFGRVPDEPGIGLVFTTQEGSTEAPEYRMLAGRALRPEDAGQPYMVIRDPFPGTFIDQLNIEVGSEITWLLRNPPGSEEPYTEKVYTIIGIIDRNSEQSGINDTFQAATGSVPEFVSPTTVFTIADIEDAYVDAALIEFAQISNVFAIDTAFLVALIERLLDQLIAVPALVAVLSLIAGVAIIANTVALDTQERRRQIGVMRAVGLKGYRVLAQIVFENALVGFVAGLLGVGIGIIATLLVGVFGDARQVEIALNLEPARNLLILAVVVSIVATLVSAWTAAAEKPLNVLRYE